MLFDLLERSVDVAQDSVMDHSEPRYALASILFKMADTKGYSSRLDSFHLLHYFINAV